MIGSGAAVGVAAVVAGVGVMVSGGVIANQLGILMARIGKSGGYIIDHHYPDDHEPLHVHISGDDGLTKIDLSGNPLSGQRPMTHGERKAFKKLYKKILKVLSKWM